MERVDANPMPDRFTSADPKNQTESHGSAGSERRVKKFMEHERQEGAGGQLEAMGNN